MLIATIETLQSGPEYAHNLPDGFKMTRKWTPEELPDFKLTPPNGWPVALWTSSCPRATIDLLFQQLTGHDQQLPDWAAID